MSGDEPNYAHQQATDFLGPPLRYVETPIFLLQHLPLHRPSPVGV